MMSVTSGLKSRTLRFLSNTFVERDEEAAVDDDQIKTHNFKTELFNIFQVGLCFCLLFGGYNTLASLTVTNVYLSIQ